MEILTAFLYNAASFIVVISVIVFVHEFGHYAVAKLAGVKIDIFSIGFGKEILGWNDKSGTRWKLSMIPLGGYVKMHGDVNAASMPDLVKIDQLSEEEKKISFHTKPLAIKAAIVAAGPLINFLLAIVILTFFFSYYGKPHATPQVNSLVKGSAAEQAGLLPGDVIASINNEKIISFSDIQRIVSIHPNDPLEFVVLRNNKEQSLTITPRSIESKDSLGNPIKVGQLGIASAEMTYERHSLGSAIQLATRETYVISAATLSALGQMITGKRSTDELGGIIQIAQYSGQSASVGFKAVFWLIALLSINLGLLNLLPIPMLDGGHLLYYIIEAVKGKPMNEQLQQYGFRFGMAIILLLMVIATYNDLSKLITSFFHQ